MVNTVVAVEESTIGSPLRVCELKFPIRERLKVNVTYLQQQLLEIPQRQQQRQKKKTGKKHRDILDIFAEILNMVSYQERKEEKNNSDKPNKRRSSKISQMGDLISISKIKSSLGLMTPALKKHIENLQKYNLITIDIFERRTRCYGRKKMLKTRHKILRLTEKGIQFLRVYEGMHELLLAVSSISPYLH
jgi:hypothetical protein